MALQLVLSLDAGIELPEAYARISAINHTHSELVVHVQTWANQAAREALKPTVASQSFSLPWVESSSLSSCYTALKALAEFSNSIDV